MSNTVGSIIRRAISTEKPNILYVPNENLYLQSVKSAIDANFVVLPSSSAPITSMNFDAVLCTDRARQFPQLFDLSCKLHIPLICYESMLPPSPQAVGEQSGVSSTINVFSQNVLAKYWNMNKYHVIQPVVEVPKHDEMDKDYKTVYFTTDANGQELVNLVRDKGMNAAMLGPEVDMTKVVYYVNTALQPHTIPSILMLLSMGAVVCTLKHPMLSEVIIDQHNGIDAIHTTELMDKLRKLLGNLELRNNIVKNAKNTIAKQYNIDLAKKRWEAVLKESKKFVFTGIL